MNTITLKVPEILNTQLNSHSKKIGLSKSEIIRIALNEYFSKGSNRASGSLVVLSRPPHEDVELLLSQERAVDKRISRLLLDVFYELEFCAVRGQATVDI